MGARGVPNGKCYQVEQLAEIFAIDRNTVSGWLET
jgi:hypothetical protein